MNRPIPQLPNGEPYNPSLKQLEFHQNPAKYRYFHGGFRSGKSYAGCAEVIKMACKYPGSRGIVGRRTYRSLKDTTWHILRSMIPHDLREKENEQNLYIRLPNGSEILGYHLQNMETLAGFELDWFYLDEAQEIDEEIFLQLCGRLSSPLGCNKGWISGTPRGKNWIWKRFVSEDRPNHAVVRVTSYENPYLTPEYIEDLKQTYDDDWIARFLRGDWDIYEGQVFDIFNEKIHLIDSFPIPSHWPRYRAIDHGIRVPTACLWATANEEGDLFITGEYYEANKDAEQNARAILERSKGFENRVVWTVADPSMTRREGTGDSVADLYRKAGLHLTPGRNAIKPSIAEIRRLLRVDPQHIHPITQEKGSPKVFIFRSCENLAWEIQQYCWPDLKKDGTGEDKPAQSPDHLIDSWRYLVQQRPYQAQQASDHGNLWDYLKGLLKKDKPQGDGIERLNTDILPIGQKEYQL